MPPRLLRHLVGIVARLRSENRSAMSPERGSGRTRTRATGALLTPRLFAAARDESLGLGRGGSAPPIRQLHPHCFMQQRIVALASEHRARDFEVADLRSRLAENSGTFTGLCSTDAFRHLPPPAIRDSSRAPHDARSRSHPSEPGTAPEISTALSSGSMSIILRFNTVAFSLPICPAIRIPLRTRPG